MANILFLYRWNALQRNKEIQTVTNQTQPPRLYVILQTHFQNFSVHQTHRKLNHCSKISFQIIFKYLFDNQLTQNFKRKLCIYFTNVYFNVKLLWQLFSHVQDEKSCSCRKQYNVAVKMRMTSPDTDVGKQ